MQISSDYDIIVLYSFKSYKQAKILSVCHDALGGHAMGMYLNPGNENFSRITKGDIYVDKTMMIAAANRFIDKGNTRVCVSRPRRFGKTLAGNMLSAYYSKGCDSAELFAPFKIASVPGFRKKLNRYNVIKIDLNRCQCDAFPEYNDFFSDKG